jgi:hypothetical protein
MLQSEAGQMKHLSKGTDLDISNFRMAAVWTFIILNLAVFLIRIDSVLHYGTLFTMQGGEAAATFPIWKAIHHLTVYEWPLAFPFSLALYNYLF